MRELVRHVAALDSVAGESLKVIGLFDALVQSRSGLEGIVRTAAALTGVPAGLVQPDRRLALRIDDDGIRHRVTETAGELAERWPSLPVSGHHPGLVWLERTGPAAAADALVLERLAMAVQSSLDRLSGGVPDSQAAIAVLVDADASDAAKAEAARLLRLPPGVKASVVVSPPGRRSSPLPSRSAVVHTTAGPLRAALLGDAALPVRAGIGTPEPLATLHDSLRSAVAALCLTTADQPLLHAADLGLLAAAELRHTTYLDSVVTAITELSAEPEGAATMQALTHSDSVRGAAALCRVHHSTLQARCERISERLGYDVRTTAGRVRLTLDLATQRLMTTRFAFED